MKEGAVARYTASIVLTFGLYENDDEAAHARLEFLSGIVQGFVTRPEFLELRPAYARELEIETTDLSGPEDNDE